MKTKNLIKSVIAASLLAAAPSYAAVDTTAVTDALTDVGVAVAVVGGAIITAKGVVIAYPWILSMMGRK